MRKLTYKLTAATLSLAMLISVGAVSSRAEGLGNSSLSMLGDFLEEANSKSSQTVYVITEADGSASKVMVSSDKLKSQEVDDLDGLPIKIKATYTLDGKEIKASDIKGASGKLKIRYDYENTKLSKIDIDGKSEEVHLPFTVSVGLVLDSEEFKNVKVSNGKVVEDGKNLLIVGMAYPSLAEDLGIDGNKLKLYDYIEIEADITDAEFSNAYTVVTNTVFSALNTNGSVTDDNALKQLVEGMNALEDGSASLYEGIGSLKEGSEALQNGISTLSTGLSTLSTNSTKLNAGAAQVFNTLLGTANSTIEKSGAALPTLTIENYGQVLDMAVASLNAAGQQATALQLSALKGQLDSYNTFYQGLLAYTGGVDKASAGALTLKTNAPALTEGASELKKGAGQLADGISELSDKTVGKISDEEDVMSILERFRAISEISADYGSYVDEGKDGYVTFIYKSKKN